VFNYGPTVAVVDEVSDAGSDADDVDNIDGLPPSLTITPKLHIVTNKVTQFAVTFIVVGILVTTHPGKSWILS